MLQVTLFSLVVSVLVPALALQVPLGSGHSWHAENQATLHDHDLTDWSLDRLPNPNDTDHLVFETVHSLLQHWPNNRMRNGHNIVPGVIPKGTLLYHGGNDTVLPLGPEWVAIDPEHSYLFCRDGDQDFRPQKGCWHITLTTTRPLKVVYFDGSSAVKIPYGPMDTQDLLAWGEVRNKDVWEETQRVEDLCGWGKNFGIDGFVRMQMDFEVVLCDFASGVSIVSSANLPRYNATPPFWPSYVPFETMNSGSWHNNFPGETRVQLDLSGLVSFYDTQLVPSLVAVRADQERLEETLSKPSGPSSGIDWRTLVQVIVDRFAGRLELTYHLLNSSATDSNELLDFVNKTQTQLRIMLTPYILLSAAPTKLSDKTDLDWSIPIYKLCATTHTRPMESELDSMTNAEKLLFRAVRGTSREICRVVTKMWASGVYAGIDSSLNTRESLDIAEVTQVWSEWAEDLNGLVAWLDWGVWVKCDPHCGPEEMCYLPTWPVGFPGFPRPPPTNFGHLSEPDRPHLERLTSSDLRTMAMESLVEEMLNTIKPGPDDWIRPQPKCIKRVAPYEF